MKAISSAMFALLLAGLLAASMMITPRADELTEAQPAAAQDGARFEAIDLFIAPAGPLAAYQLEFRARRGTVKIVGIEGGEHPDYAQPPYYDPAAMQQDRVVIGALSTRPASELPNAKVRIARIHVMVEGGAPEYEARLQTAAGPDTQKIEAALAVEPVHAADGGEPR